MHRTNALIIGYGNPLRGDDGIGQAVAEVLANETIDGADVIACHQLTPELAERLATVDLAVFIDAEAGIQPGSVVVTQLEASSALSSGLVHHLNPEALLFICTKLYGRSPKAVLVAVGAGSLELSEALSEPVAAALPEAVAVVRQLVLDHVRAGSASH